MLPPASVPGAPTAGGAETFGPLKLRNVVASPKVGLSTAPKAGAAANTGLAPNPSPKPDWSTDDPAP
ncbi:GL22525 [Drosophila persimilis]|uniref:GL22525 n=1 Tax=Drosophila persimilis TaxID=7234 RepID=B4H188_DROPE|nr:GL22525 [Drosophila persimilis]